MRRIGMVITDLEWGGAEKSFYHLAYHLHSTQWAVDAIGLGAMGSMGRRLQEEGIPVSALGLRKSDLVKGGLQLRKRAQRGDWDLVFSSLFHANVLAALALKGLNIPQVSSTRGGENQTPWRYGVSRLTWRTAAMHTAVSGSTADDLSRLSGVPRDRITVIPNGVTPPSRSPAYSRAKSLRLLFVGRLTEQKNVRALLQVASALRGAGVDFKLCIVGDGEDRDRLIGSSRSLELEPYVEWVGRDDDVSAWYRWCHVLLLPSSWEGCPNVVLEAMAHARPVVAAPVGGVAELIEPGRHGFLLDSERIGDWVRVLRETPNTEWRRMGRAGRERVQEEFTYERMNAAYCDVFAEALAPAEDASGSRR